MGRNPAIKLSERELNEMFADLEWSKKFPPILDVVQAATLGHVPLATLYEWSSRGLLTNCANKRGKRLKIMRNRFVRFLMEEQQ